MKLRPYHEDDASATFEVFHRAVTQTAQEHYTARQVSLWVSRAGGLADWRQRMNGAQRAFVAEDEAGVFAYATLVAQDPDTAEVHQLMCHPRRARQGAASTLLERLIHEAKDLGYRKLTAQASRSSLAVFERQGFTVREPKTVMGMRCYRVEKDLIEAP